MRADGFRCKNANAMYTIVSHFMTKRTDSMNFITLDFPKEPLRKYINEQRKKGHNVSHLAIILAAYVRMIAKYPELNRFVVNKRFYARKDISVAMVVLKPGHSGEETESKLYFEPTDTIFDVNKKIEEYLETNRAEGEVNSLDSFVNKVARMTGLMSIAMSILRWLDKHGFLPKSVLDFSPFHASLLITNLASIRTNHIYHHVYEFGTISISMALGNAHDVVKYNKKEDKVECEKCIPAGIVMDERIATGYYFSKAIRYFNNFINNPELLEEAPDTVVYDDGVKDMEKKLAKYKAKREKKANKKK